MSATLRDLARWGQAYLDRPSRQEVIPRAFVTDILANNDPAVITKHSFPGPRTGLAPNSAYRSFHWVNRHPGEVVISASGHFGQFCNIFPKRKLVFVKFSTYEDFSTIDELLELDQRDRSAFCAIADVVAGKAL